MKLQPGLLQQKINGMMQSGEIRQKFLDFFKSKGHIIVPSAPIVIKNDPTLLFTNAGMNQFKEFFLGHSAPSAARIADTQKCLRVSGKHNDLEEVGVDTYHHTMFEMLGNWSFGNVVGEVQPYFKEEAIGWSWELLTKVYGITEQDLYVTVFGGDTPEGLPKDDESEGYWKKWISSDRIISGSKKDNFWEMGETGPCGPCTEIHVDCRTPAEKRKIPGIELVNKDHPQVIEIWNNVFIQYNRKANGSLETLPARHVDTGMGFERLVRILQKKQSNYDTDIFTTLIHETELLANCKYSFSDSKKDVAFRVIADHIRAVAFPIADGQLPSNTGAGYVIRRILRRAVRYYYSYLDLKEPLLYKLLPTLAKQFDGVFPEIAGQQEFISKVIQEEETGFLRTLEKGLRRVNEFFTSASAKKINGEEAFELYDTYGFPLDLTMLIATENNFEVDAEAFQQEMQKQKNRSRAASVVDSNDWVTIDHRTGSEFTGYTEHQAEAHLLKYRRTKSQGRSLYQLVLDKTPFYAESGGQVGDTGALTFGDEMIEVINTKRENNEIVHFTEKLPGKPEAVVTAKIDEGKRKSIARHHSATHLLHAALRQILGSHVQQKGSLVNNDYLRFDFSHFAKVSNEELKKMELIVNQMIRANIPVISEEMDKEAALKKGAMALFGEKYADKVRVVTMDPAFSIELCGGTHVNRTGDLGFFKITGETAVGAGTRRIEAISGELAVRRVQEESGLLREVREKFKNSRDLQKAIDATLAENAELRKQLESAEAAQLQVLKEKLVAGKQMIGEVSLITGEVKVSSADSLKKLGFLLKNEVENYVVAVLANVSGKAAAVVMLDEPSMKLLNTDAPKLIKETIAPRIKGGGGGQKNLATAGGNDVSRFREIFDEVASRVQQTAK